jgi:hypothetical protein
MILQNKKFYIASIILLLSATIVNECSDQLELRSRHYKHKFFLATDSEKDQFSNEADKSAKLAQTALYVSLFIAVIGFVLWLISFIRKEPAKQFIPLILLLIFVFWLFTVYL